MEVITLKNITVSEDEYDMILEALRLTKYIKFLNEETKLDYRQLGIKLGDTEE